MKYTKIIVYAVLYLITLAIVVSSLLVTPQPFTAPFLPGMRIVIICFATILLTTYTLYMVVAPWHTLNARRKQERRVHSSKVHHTLVSVMIPAWNEECGLINTIKTLLDSTYKNMELVIVNDGSTDNSHDMMQRFLAKYEREMNDVPWKKQIRIIYHYQQNGGKGSALNTAISLSRGDILISIDADCVVDKHCIAAFVDTFQDSHVMAAVGNVKIANTKTLLGVIQALEFNFSFYLKKCDSLLNTIYIIGGAAGAFRREVFEKLGKYSLSNITEDIELSMRIQNQGWKVVYVPHALVLTEGATTLKGLMKQRLRWKRGRFQTFWSYRHMFFSRNPEHNKMLCWLILPMTLFREVQLCLEPLFLLALYLFSLISHDSSAFLSGIIVVSLMFFIQAYDAKDQQQRSYIWLAPIGWLLFYICSFVECYALITSLWMMIRKKEATWQRWQRKGAID